MIGNLLADAAAWCRAEPGDLHDASSGKMAASPEIHARGSGIDDAAFGEVLPKIEEAPALAAADGIADIHLISQLARRIVGKWVSDNYRRPMIIPVVIQA